MKAEDLLSLPWKHVTDWSGLGKTWVNDFGFCETDESDMNLFIHNICREIAQKTKISYEEVEASCIKEEKQ